jgi:hypothetical protein
LPLSTLPCPPSIFADFLPSIRHFHADARSLMPAAMPLPRRRQLFYDAAAAAAAHVLPSFAR